MSILGWGDLGAFFPEFPAADRWIPLLRVHSDLMAEWSSRVNLTAVTPEEAVRRHYAESLEIWRAARGLGPVAVAIDVGSGAGFPGLVAAAVSPDISFDLVEPQGKRAAFLRQAAAEMGLANVTIHQQRAEDAGRGGLRESGDVVLARAVTALPVLVEYTAPLARLGGRLALAKGSSAEAELQAALAACRELGCEPRGLVSLRPELSGTPWLAVFDKVAATSSRYPRRAGIAAKRPIEAEKPGRGRSTSLPCAIVAPGSRGAILTSAVTRDACPAEER